MRQGQYAKLTGKNFKLVFEITIKKMEKSKLYIIQILINNQGYKIIMDQHLLLSQLLGLFSSVSLTSIHSTLF